MGGEVWCVAVGCYVAGFIAHFAHQALENCGAEGTFGVEAFFGFSCNVGEHFFDMDVGFVPVGVEFVVDHVDCVVAHEILGFFGDGF